MATIPKIGGHVSAAGGLYKVVENAEAIGAEAIQIFGASPRQWFPKLPSEEDFQKFKDTIKGTNVGPVYLHASYLVNLGSADVELRKKSIKNLATHLLIAEGMGVEGLIFHVGSGKKDISKDKAIQLAGASMKEVLKKAPGKAQLIIENAAGGGEKIGRTAQEIGELMRIVKSSRVKVCFDTAHAFEAGIIDEYTPQKVKALVDEWDKEIGGIKNLVALHINDSKTPFDSHHDRHENLGEGYIGLGAFKVLAKERRLHHAAWMLEVPGFKGGGPDIKNVKILRKCFK